MVRREKQFYQDLSNKLQYTDRLHCLERIAIVQPMRFDKFQSCFQSCASSCSHRSNFSAISVLLGNQDLSGASHVRRLYFSMPEVNHLNKNSVVYINSIPSPIRSIAGQLQCHYPLPHLVRPFTTIRCRRSMDCVSCCADGAGAPRTIQTDVPTLPNSCTVLQCDILCFQTEARITVSACSGHRADVYLVSEMQHGSTGQCTIHSDDLMRIYTPYAGRRNFVSIYVEFNIVSIECQHIRW